MRIFLHDVCEAYLKSAEPLSRTIYLKQMEEDPKWFGVSSSEVLKLHELLYGLWNLEDYWNQTSKNHITNNLGMIPCISVPSLYLKINDGKVIGLTESCVYDRLNAGIPEFEAFTEETLK